VSDEHCTLLDGQFVERGFQFSEKASRSRVQSASAGDWLLPIRRDLLHDVFGVGGIGHTPADEDAQPRPFFRYDFGDLTVLPGHWRDARRFIHPLL
jgi:hypothetical protein